MPVNVFAATEEIPARRESPEADLDRLAAQIRPMPGDTISVMTQTFLLNRNRVFGQTHSVRRAKYRLLAEMYEISLWARRDLNIEKEVASLLDARRLKFKDTSSLLLRLLCIAQPLGRDVDPELDLLSDRARKTASRDLAAIYWAAVNGIAPAQLVDFLMAPDRGLETCAALWANHRRVSLVTPKGLKVVPASAEVILLGDRIDEQTSTISEGPKSSDVVSDDGREIAAIATDRPDYSGEALTLAINMRAADVSLPPIDWTLEGRNSYLRMRIKPLNPKPRRLVAGLKRENGALYIEDVRERRSSSGDKARWVDASYGALDDTQASSDAEAALQVRSRTAPLQNHPILDWDGVSMALLREFYDARADEDQTIYIEVTKSKKDLRATVLKHHRPSAADMVKIRKILINGEAEGY